MPRHNRPDISEALRKFFDVDPPGFFDTIGPEIVPTFPITPPDVEGYPPIYRRGIATAEAAASVGNLSLVALHVEGDPGVAVEVEGLWVKMSVSGELDIRTDPPVGGVVASSIDWRDRRLPGDPAATIRASNPAAPQGTLSMRVDVVAGETLFLPINYILTADDALGVESVTPNVAVRANFLWRERELFPKE
jgi:hypothetical protein